MCLSSSSNPCACLHYYCNRARTSKITDFCFCSHVNVVYAQFSIMSAHRKSASSKCERKCRIIISLSLFQHKMFNCVSYKFGVKRKQTKFNTIKVRHQRVVKNLIERGLPLLEVLTRATEYLFFLFSSNFINHIVLCVCVCARNQPRTLQQFVHTHSITKMMSF